MSTQKLNGRVIQEAEHVRVGKKRVDDENIYFFWTLDKLYEYYDTIKDTEDTGTGQGVQPVREG